MFRRPVTDMGRLCPHSLPLSSRLTFLDVRILKNAGVCSSHLAPALRAKFPMADSDDSTDENIMWTMPSDDEVTLFWKQLYQDDMLNGAKPLHFVQTAYAVSRSYGSSSGDDDGDSKLAKASLNARIFSIPTVSDLLKMVWGLIPLYIRQKIKKFAKNQNAEAIAKEISSFVVTVLGRFSIPSFLVSAIAGILIPQIVSLLITAIDTLPMDTKNGSLIQSCF